MLDKQQLAAIQERHDDLNENYNDEADGHKLLDAHIDRGILLKQIWRMKMTDVKSMTEVRDCVNPDGMENPITMPEIKGLRIINDKLYQYQWSCTENLAAWWLVHECRDE